VAVVGVGLPLVCPEREALRTYHGEDGFARAYQAPGMSKVTQAVGRVIRTAEDRGVALLIDDRFGQHSYQKMMPPWWGGGISAASAEEIRRKAREFWKKEDQ